MTGKIYDTLSCLTYIYLSNFVCLSVHANEKFSHEVSESFKFPIKVSEKFVGSHPGWLHESFQYFPKVSGSFQPKVSKSVHPICFGFQKFLDVSNQKFLESF